VKFEFILPLVGALVVSGVARAADAELMPGSMAPRIAVKHWVKGSPVTSFSDNGTYVVEFWATWCGPCIESIPHITELAKKNPSVKFVGVSIWEDDSSDSVAKFVAKMGPKMDYHIAYGGNQDGMALTWMKAAAQNGIPTAFIVKNQKIQWIGHPMMLEAPLAEVLQDKNDLEKSKDEFLKRAAAANERQKLSLEVEAIEKLFDGGKKAEAHSALDKLEQEHPSIKPQTQRTRMIWQAEENPIDFAKKVDDILSKGNMNDVYTIAGICPTIASVADLRDTAVSAIDKILAGIKHKDLIVFYYATSTYRNAKASDKAKAVATAAIALMDSNKDLGNEQMRKFFLAD
jgi:thiol-disulfide isomerase/thioredoxin